VTVDSAESSRHFAFSRHGSKPAILFITFKNCIFCDASFELITYLATLNPEKLQGFYGILLFHCYTLPYTKYCCGDWDLPSQAHLWKANLTRRGLQFLRTRSCILCIVSNKLRVYISVQAKKPRFPSLAPLVNTLEKFLCFLVHL